MRQVPDFLKDLGSSLNPWAYKDLQDRAIRYAFRHFFFVVLIGVLVSGLLYLPGIFNFATFLKDSLDNANELQLLPHFDLKEPIIYKNGGKNIFIIDADKIYSPNSTTYYLDSNYFYRNFGSKREPNVEAFNVITYKSKIMSLIDVLSLVILPSLLVAYFIVVFATMLSIIVFISIVLYMIFYKKRVGLQKLLTIGFYASIILIMGRIVSALRGDLKTELPVLGLFLVYYVVAILLGGSRSRKKETKHIRQGDHE